MKHYGFAITLVATLAAGPTVTAQATPAGLSGQLVVAAHSLDMLEQTQYIYGGRRYCWYFDGWHGPGWYWCGYDRRQGYGWGGDTGWNGWERGVQPRERQHEGVQKQVRQPRGDQPQARQPQGKSQPQGSSQPQARGQPQGGQSQRGGQPHAGGQPQGGGQPHGGQREGGQNK